MPNRLYTLNELAEIETNNKIIVFAEENMESMYVFDLAKDIYDIVWHMANMPTYSELVYLICAENKTFTCYYIDSGIDLYTLYSIFDESVDMTSGLPVCTKSLSRGISIMKTSVLEILDEIAAEPGRNKKIEIVEKYKNHKEFKQVLKLTYDPYINFYMRDIPPEFLQRNNNQDELSTDLTNVLNELEHVIADRLITGYQAYYSVGMKVRNLTNKSDKEVVKRVLKRDLRCGINTSTINKVFGKSFIPTYPCLLGKNYDEKTIKKISWPAYSQTKADGVRVNIFVDDDVVEFRGRSGKEIFVHEHFDDEFKELFKNLYQDSRVVLDGEILVSAGKYDSDGNEMFMERKKGNGIVNKAIRGTISKKESEMFRFQLWDIIDMDKFVEKYDPMPYKDRLARLQKCIGLYQEMYGEACFDVIDTREVKNYHEAEVHFEECLSRGDEGTMLKNMDSVWEDKRSPNLIKFKAEKDADLKITQWNEGKGKWEGMVGSLVCESKDGEVVVNISGFTDKEREDITNNIDDYIGRIITVRYNERIKSKVKGREHLDSLFLPRFVEVRLDKDEADPSEKIT